MERVWKIAVTGVAGVVAAVSLTAAALVLVGGRLSDAASPVRVTPPVLVPSPVEEIGGGTPSASSDDHRGTDDGSPSPAQSSGEVQDAASPDGVEELSDDDPAGADFDD